MLHTTLEKLHDAGACTSSYRELTKSLGGVTKYGKDTPIPLDKILEVCGLDDALWCLRAIIEDADKEIRLFACDCAEQVLHIFEEVYPDDKRPRQAIEVARRFANGEATIAELTAAENAARDARATAAVVAGTTAGDTGVAAGAAAWATARAAAWAAAGATAGDATRAAAGTAEWKWQTKRFRKLLDKGMDNPLGEYKGKTVLITGGAGCIGSNLTKALIDCGAKEVIVLDDLSAAAVWNIPDDPRVVFAQGSVLDDAVLKKVFIRTVDYVFHLAAHFANQNSVDNPETDLLVNGLGTLKVLQYSLLAKVTRVVFASSGCSVYGSQAPLPLKEDFVSTHLDTPYQITKLLGELYCNFFCNYYGLPIAIARYFNVYGPGEIPGAYRNVIPNFIWRALHKEPLIITGTGEETRDFTFVDDIVNGTLRLGTMPNTVGDAFNLASEVETKVNDIARIVNEITGNPNGVVFTDSRDWDKITRRRASIEKAGSVLGYTPKMELEKGIRTTYNWIKSNYDRIRKDARF